MFSDVPICQSHEYIRHELFDSIRSERSFIELSKPSYLVKDVRIGTFNTRPKHPTSFRLF